MHFNAPWFPHIQFWNPPSQAVPNLPHICSNALNRPRTNDQPGQDGPPTNQTTVPEDPKNDHEAANQTAELEMPSLVTQIAPEKCPEALACE
ncbi:hypothetical protein DSO57_1018670 [Entomophthora muscae]|uniref:Uncharacterized protein n=1 Tax=Entomophthora muscae TaxID=34485 RepID=A0ACC2U293_9FUNG|nr:hypothetical protein DSO57_1018670 [Entomophthora muscae]